MEKILFTSIPKSGTHLLLRYFDITGFKHAGPFGGLVFDEKFYDFVQNLQAGEYSAWHYFWNEKLVSIIRNIGAKVVFLYRDPRAQVCSYTNFIMRTSAHPFYNLFQSQRNDEERIKILFQGLPHQVQGVAGFYKTHELWLSNPDVYKVRFEDIVGPKGGGSVEKQLQVVRELIDFTGGSKDNLVAKVVAEALFDQNSVTFDKGQIDSWHKYFTPELHDLFMQETGDLLKVWGYNPVF